MPDEEPKPRPCLLGGRQRSAPAVICGEQSGPGRDSWSQKWILRSRIPDGLWARSRHYPVLVHILCARADPLGRQSRGSLGSSAAAATEPSWRVGRRHRIMQRRSGRDAKIRMCPHSRRPHAWKLRLNGYHPSHICFPRAGGGRPGGLIDYRILRARGARAEAR